MDAPKRADENSAAGDGAGQEAAEDLQGRASAFRRALDAQVEVDDPGQALVPNGPHDLTVSIERARMLEVLADPQPAGMRAAVRQTPTAAVEPGARTEAGDKDPQTRLPVWLPAIHWVGAAADGHAVDTAEDAPENSAEADSPAILQHGTPTSPAQAPAVPGEARIARQDGAVPPAAVSAKPASRIPALARTPRDAQSRQPEQALHAGSPPGPSPKRGGRRKPELRLAILASAALATVAAITLMLTNDGSAPHPTVTSALPTETIPSKLAILPTAGPSGGKAPAGRTSKASASATASSKSSRAASPSASGADADAAAKETTTSNVVSETVSPSATTAAHVPSASAAASSASAGATDGSALANSSTGSCLNTPGATYTAGTEEEVSACGGGAFQAWTLTSSGQLTQDGGSYCLDDYSWGSTPGTAVDLWPCNGQTNQQWTIESDGSIVGSYSGLCVSLTGEGPTVELEQCDDQASQLWSWR